MELVKILGARRLRWVGMFVMIISLFLTACGANKEQQANTNPQTKEKLRIGYLNVMDDAQVMLAYDAGFYEKNGLEVEVQIFNSGPEMIKAIVGGQLDAGVLGFTNAVTWADKGADLKVISGAQMGYHSLLVRSDRNIKTIPDLKGKQLATQKQGSTADIVLNGVVLKEGNLTRNDVNMVYVSPSVAIQSLTAGKVDAAFLFEPYDRIARKTIPVTPLYDVGEEWPFPCMVAITSGKILQEKQIAINKMLDAQKEAIEMLENQPKEAAKILAKRFIETETIDTTNGRINSVDLIAEAIEAQTFNWEITQENIQQMKDIVQMMIDQQMLSKPLNVEDILDLSWQNKKQS